MRPHTLLCLGAALLLQCDAEPPSTDSEGTGQHNNTSGNAPNSDPSALIAGQQPTDPIISVTHVALGQRELCAATADGQVACWGHTEGGQIATGGGPNSGHRPLLVAGIEDAVEVGVGADFFCARQSAGDILCWGSNNNGQLGNGQAAEPRSVPDAPGVVAGVLGAIDLCVGPTYACAVHGAGGVSCWGAGTTGILCNDAQDFADQAEPTPIPSVQDAVEVGCGHQHACALLESGSVVCWGSNLHGSLGNGRALPGRRTEIFAVDGVAEAIQVSVGAYHACVLDTHGAVLCWGANDSGQTGSAQPVRSLPRHVTGINNGVFISTGGDSSCVTLTDGTARCWGNNAEGQLGNGSTQNTPIPIPIAHLTDLAAVYMGQAHGCAITHTQEVVCWGAGFPEL